ncbi:MAG: indolepyruvate oxidoreductase subunit beta [Bacteroidaceae bacterium]|jgi:indolepyruvate ferredoxin oxidoreductase beta subunit|nr:indolepyruvate oxidoreductase subunit beta [Bacteroidaceae bacterium]MBO7260241.1 indolepyruvate oxidoreductase subunit beta [Bacteroidaceae bacterium]
MKTDIILAGVGGQGILSIATVIGQAALEEGLYIKQAEVHGMSQRGGDVQSNLRISDQPIASDLISLGQADVIIAMEPMEALRYKQYLSTDGWIITSSNPFVNIGNYPELENIIAELKAMPNVVLIDTEALGKENKMPKAVNMILLGAASRALNNISFEKLAESIKSIFGRKGDAIVEMNIKALEIGKNCQ